MESHPSSTSDFIKLLTGHQASLRAFIVSLMPGSSDVDDVLQDTNVVIWEKMESFELGTNFQAWAFTIARNMIKAYWKKAQRDQSLALNPAIIDSIVENWLKPNSKQTTQKQAALNHCLATLKQAERDLIDIRYAKTTSIKHQARDLNRSSASIRVSLFRIREKLRCCVQARLAISEGGAV